jgi:hypothetical protein
MKNNDKLKDKKKKIEDSANKIIKKYIKAFKELSK